MIFVIGLFPSIFLDRMKDSVSLAYNQYKNVSDQAIRFGDERGAQLLPTPRTSTRRSSRAPRGHPQGREATGRRRSSPGRRGTRAVALAMGETPEPRPGRSLNQGAAR